MASKLKLLCFSILCVSILALCVLPLQAQQVTVYVGGRITDTTDAVVPGASVNAAWREGRIIDFFDYKNLLYSGTNLIA